jgi:hypothetical protein
MNILVVTFCCIFLGFQSRSRVQAFLPNLKTSSSEKHSVRAIRKVEFQSDESLFGRGENHLSALLQEGDLVLYQTGSWQVDGVTVWG